MVVPVELIKAVDEETQLESAGSAVQCVFETIGKLRKSPRAGIPAY